MQSRSIATRNVSLFEPLETRTLMSVSTDSAGWTNVTPSSDSRIVFVSSSSGNDNNNGLSSGAAVKTIAKAKTLMRNGMPDEMLLKRGDTWNESFGTWRTSGRSEQEMQLIGTYGSGERPILNTGTSEGFLTAGGNPINYVAITGVHFVANGYTGSNGGYQTSAIRLIREGHDYLIQDVEINGYKDNITIDGDGAGVSDVTVRRSADAVQPQHLREHRRQRTRRSREYHRPGLGARRALSCRRRDSGQPLRPQPDRRDRRLQICHRHRQCDPRRREQLGAESRPGRRIEYQRGSVCHHQR
jgi:hypothetical protein